MSIARTVLEFLDAPIAPSWDLSPKEAMDFFASKGIKPTFDYREMLGQEHARAFTVAKLMDADLLADMKASLEDAQATGKTFKEWQDGIIPSLQAKGWWGRKAVTDPLTGQTVMAQLGSPSRLQTIYRSNMQSAYAAGQWDVIVDQADIAPLLLYDAVDDYRTRPEHAAWDNTLLPVTDGFWRTHYPPNGWNCRCGVIQLSEEEAEELGLAPNLVAPDDGTYPWKSPVSGKTMQIPKGIDPGWNTNAGVSRQKSLAKVQADKLAAYEAEFAEQAAKALAKAEAEATATLAAALEELEAAAQAVKVQGLAQERAAGKAIAKALEAKTPFLAKAIKKLQLTKAGQAMSSSELLTAAKAKAVYLEAETDLYTWKVAAAGGKKIPAKAQAYFDNLPEEVQLALKAEIDVAKASAEAAVAAEAAALAAEAELAAAIAAAEAQAAKNLANAAAGQQLDDLSKGTKLQSTAVAKAIKSGEGKDALEILAEVEADLAAQAVVSAFYNAKSATKKALLAGKVPSPAQAKFLEELSPDAKAAFLAEVDLAKAKDAPAPPPVPGIAPQVIDAPGPAKPLVDDQLDSSTFVQIGAQKGSNTGGLYQDPATGDTWYIKTPASEDHVRNEILASKLYDLAGAQLPELRFTTMGGKASVASRFQGGLEQAAPAKLAKAPGTMEHFAADAWLANWDVVGMAIDNLALKGSQAFRIDVGGSLRYRAMGGAKGAAWGPTVRELDSLRDGSNPQTAKVFKGITQAQLKASAERLLKLDRQAIDDLVERYGPRDAAERTLLKATLRARLDDIAQKLGIEPDVDVPAPVVTPAGKRITAAEFDRITEARVNGYVISTDGGDIEDHQVLLQHFTDSAGKKKTRLVAKLRADGAARTRAQAIAAAGGESAPSSASLANLRTKAKAMAISINSRANKGAEWDTTVETRLDDFLEARDAARKALAGPQFASPAGKASLAALESIDALVDAWRKTNGPNRKLTAIAQLDVETMRDVDPIELPGKPKPKGLAWKRTNGFAYQLGVSKAGRLTETASTSTIRGVTEALEAQGDGYRVRFVTDVESNSISSRGLVHIEIDGDDLGAAERAIDRLEELGVTTTRTTTGERVGLYLDKLANLRTLRNRALQQAYRATDAIKDEAERNARKLELLNADVGYDISRSPHWNPEGIHQAFGHGRTLLMRPDLDGPEMKKFEKSKVVYTNVTGGASGSVSADSRQWERLLGAIDGGGILSSQMERSRRGLAPTAESTDFSTGGANYVFTRLRAASASTPGVYWNPRVMRRMDVFSYELDAFGRVERSEQLSYGRQVDAAGFTRNSANGKNESNFRDGISLFDDLERIIFASESERLRAIADMRARGYETWPDGRKLEVVLQGPKR